MIYPISPARGRNRAVGRQRERAAATMGERGVMSIDDARGQDRPVAIGTVGLGGYAGTICRLLEQQSRGECPPVRLAGVFEPDVLTHAGRLEELRAAGVPVAGSYEELLAGPAEAVWLPLPIDLHRPFTEAALAAGKAVMCEKPAAGSIDDLLAMIAARDRAGRPVAIGFQDLYDPAAHEVKRRLLAGVIGRPQSATLVACWPRPLAYFARNGWAGRFRRGGVWVMDSPASNAISHFLNLTLFWLGEEPGAMAAPVAIEAELYRANDIENYDTCSLRVQTASGATALVLLTHACRDLIDAPITITGDEGTLEAVRGRGVTLRDNDGATTFQIALAAEPRVEMVRQFAGRVSGALDDRAVATLEGSIAHLTVVNGASEAAAVHPVPVSEIDLVPSPGGAQARAIRGIEAAFAACARGGQLLSESGLVGWSVPPGRRDLRDYRHFAGPADPARA